jgi:DNA-binding response OmpR family regulator
LSLFCRRVKASAFLPEQKSVVHDHASFIGQEAEECHATHEADVRILVVEDEIILARTIAKSLETEYVAIDMAHDGDTGLQLASEIDYEAIILDWDLPRLDGLTLLRKLRKAGSNARVLMIGSKKSVADRVCALESGADDYLLNPFSMEELVARVQALMRRPRQLVEKISIGDLELDRTHHTVKRAGKTIHLTHREFGVLEVLMRNAGRTVTRSMVVEHVWNLDFEGLTNIVDVYIRYLRQKIDRGYYPPLIHTARGRGYILAAPPDQAN